MYLNATRQLCKGLCIVICVQVGPCPDKRRGVAAGRGQDVILGDLDAALEHHRVGHERVPVLALLHSASRIHTTHLRFVIPGMS